MKEDKIDMLKTKAGMVLSRSVYDSKGRLLLPADFILTPKTIILLKLNEVETVYVKNILVEDEPEENLENNRIERIRETQAFKIFDEAYGHSVVMMQKALNNILTANDKVDTPQLLKEMNRILSVNQNHIQVFDMLYCIHDYDDSTYVHSVNVALICNVIGHWLKFSEGAIEELTLAGLLHDIGKLMMPKEIITKPSGLTQEEYAVIKTHPAVGYEVLRSKNLTDRVKLAALEHHEKCDGSGYPNGLAAGQIDLFAKIVCIADIYDAMTANRVYRAGMCPFDVIDLFEKEGLQKYDIQTLLAFMEHIVSAYMNKQVMLSNGEQAKIILINKNRLSRPVVWSKDHCIDLSKDYSLEIKAIL